MCVREYVSAYSYVRMQAWHSSVYPWAYAASARGSNLVYMHKLIRQGWTQERGLQVRPTIRKAEGGGGGTLQALYPPLYGILTYSMVKVTSLLGGDPTPPTPHPTPLRRLRHVVTQWYVLLFLIMCAYGLAVYNVK